MASVGFAEGAGWRETSVPHRSRGDVAEVVGCADDRLGGGEVPHDRDDLIAGDGRRLRRGVGGVLAPGRRPALPARGHTDEE